MIQIKSFLKLADNSGATIVECVRMYKSKGWAPDKTINMDAWVE